MITWLTHPDCELHDVGPHPEQPARLRAIEEKLAASALAAQLKREHAPLAQRAHLLLAHTEGHVERLEQAERQLQSGDEELLNLDPDTAMTPHSLRAALRAAGAAVTAVDRVLGDECKKAFCAARPPGHHATRGQAMGFCLFNNIAIAACHALHTHGLERVAILDFDVHHGNGTEDIVSGDERILFCSTFQHPLYPGSGTGATAANVINTPLATGTGGDGFRAAVAHDWLPRLEQFAPQLLLVSAGFDAHRDDPLAGLNLVEEDYRWAGQVLTEAAQASAGGALVATLEGGYNLQALSASVQSFLEGLTARNTSVSG